MKNSESNRDGVSKSMIKNVFPVIGNKSSVVVNNYLSKINLKLLILAAVSKIDKIANYEEFRTIIVVPGWT